MNPWIEISYPGFCCLGGLENPRLMTWHRNNARGQYLQTIYLYRRF